MVSEGSLERAYKQPFLTEMPRIARCLEGAQNLGGEVMWASWFEVLASHLDELMPGQ